jgi:hypothetical protein
VIERVRKLAPHQLKIAKRLTIRVDLRTLIAPFPDPSKLTQTVQIQ